MPKFLLSLPLLFIFACSAPSTGMKQTVKSTNTDWHAAPGSPEIITMPANQVESDIAEENVCIRWGMETIKIPGSSIHPLHVDGRGIDSLAIVDYNHDKKPVMLVLVDDAFRGGISHLIAMRMVDNAVEPVVFKAPDDVYDELVIKNHIVIIQKDEYIYAYCSDAMNEEESKIQIDKYKWSPQYGYFTFVGSKLFDDFPAKLEMFKF
ncbi:MAG: hypothetical protein JO154_07530 [Chitinophaga sp.]|uniref:hypothetical protein n=1 Tax=Chitinophaga sp. TaxID=1869181 RepID=UPI0025C03D56|nr:hypothetical protein [Chitinophaga sp.]MBV8252443.1 hypothetical protein [Chitinophaga sp.]